MGLTPMMKQYFDIKKNYPDEILFFRLGDFYEMFDQDALIASELLGITLTARSKGENKMPMCGVPYHSASGYIAKLTKLGKKVAICEQVSQPGLGGIVKREVVKVITPSTTLDENVLDDRVSNFLIAIYFEENQIAVARAEMSTGEFSTAILNSQNDLLTDLIKFKPKEIIFDQDQLEKENFRLQIENFKKHYNNAFWHSEKQTLEDLNQLEKQFSKNQLDQIQLSIAEKNAAMLALNFLAKTQKTEIGSEKLKHIDKIQNNQLKYLTLDETTINNLEILENLREKKTEGSLLSVIDQTITSSGARLMKKIIVQPLADIEEIEKRLQIIDYFLANQNHLLDLRLILKNILDIERILARLNLGSGNARDMRGLINSFQAISNLKEILLQYQNLSTDNKNYTNSLNQIVEKINLLPDLISILNLAIVEEPPFSIKEGGLIAEGFNLELDELKNLSREGKNFILALQKREIERTGINSLKVKFNKVFGYYIEISNANLAQVPEDYTRKQTLANAERFSTPELKEYEEKILTAEEKISEIELRIFEELRQAILEETSAIKETASAVAFIDVMLSLSLVSWENRYVRPEIQQNYDLNIIEGRHAVIEKLNPQDRFIPNDTILNRRNSMKLITGPNMGGKSTYLRQTALIVLMAHLGMYVPASKAQISLVDRIFTRVGASDNLVKGQSTFWLEMEETALILNQATENSLIVLDEIGRGTSTFDGVSIAWGIMEYLHDQIKAKTLFASHYHELINLADQLENAVNFSVKVEEISNGEIAFLYKIVQGGINRSYGIEVAKLAGLPKNVIDRAREILNNLENQKSLSNENKQLDIFENQDLVNQNLQQNHRSLKDIEKELELKKLEDALRQINVNEITPLEALNKLQELKKLSE